LSSIAFSPDGQTLATSGNGEVPLWDFRVPPGKLSNVAAK
jgi:WD40 repeat protein